jgi:hypothetical protein
MGHVSLDIALHVAIEEDLIAALASRWMGGFVIRLEGLDFLLEEYAKRCGGVAAVLQVE